MALGLAAALAAPLTPAVTPASAQDFPTRVIRVVVPFPPGGTSDIVARLVAQAASEGLGQQVVIENKPGAAGNIGTETVARAAPDGYTLVQCTIGTCAVNVGLYKALPYDLARDFTPVIMTGAVSNLLTVNPSVPARTVAELIALAKKRPGDLNYASSGSGASNHLAPELMKTMAGIDIVHVPYRGSGPAINDLLAGQVQIFFDNTPSILPHVKSGAVQALASTGAQRDPATPDLPTMAEAGLPAFEIAPWFGFLAPARTPQAVVDRLNAEFNAALAKPELKARFADLGVTPQGGTPARFGEHIRAEVEKWGKVIRDNNIKAD
jgi:tripartite-type tricarboxylate transporter receptor subunit TctC